MHFINDVEIILTALENIDNWKLLYHGTGKNSCRKIVEEGFNSGTGGYFG